MGATTCTRCGEILDPKRIQWLEFSQTDSCYYSTLPSTHTSQGAFPFGQQCARQAVQDTLANIKKKLSGPTHLPADLREKILESFARVKPTTYIGVALNKCNSNSTDSEIVSTIMDLRQFVIEYPERMLRSLGSEFQFLNEVNLPAL